MRNHCLNIAATITTLVAVSPAFAENAYNPTINSADFTTKIDNPFFNMPVGKMMIYEAKTEEGAERVEIVILGVTKKSWVSKPCSITKGLS